MFGTHLGFTTDFPSTPCLGEKNWGAEKFLEMSRKFHLRPNFLKNPLKATKLIKIPLNYFC